MVNGGRGGVAAGGHWRHGAVSRRRAASHHHDKGGGVAWMGDRGADIGARAVAGQGTTGEGARWMGMLAPNGKECRVRTSKKEMEKNERGDIDRELVMLGLTANYNTS